MTDVARSLLLGPLLGGSGLRRLAGALRSDAEAVRRQAGELAAVAAGAVWCSTAADACRARLAGFGSDLLAVAARLDAAADAVARHAQTAGRRAEDLVAAGWDLLRTVPGAGGIGP